MRLSSRDLLAVTGLLHDVGKFRQRRGERGPHAEIGVSLIDELADLFPYEWLDDLRDGVGNHHRPPRKEIEKIVKLADWLASGERQEVAGIARQDPAEAALVPVTARVALLHDPPEGSWGYRLRPLALDAEVIFPARDHHLSPEEYEAQWDRFRAEVGRLPKLQDRQQIGSLAALLRKYVCFVPSATPWEEDEEFRTLPDISLYDHLKVTSGLCAALTGLSPDHLDALLRREDAVQDRSVCLAIRADLSGIQPFIYRITEGGAEGKGTAKRLRGRSLYITLLAEAMAQSLLERLDMPPTALMYCGGGRFDLLAPLGSSGVVTEWAHRTDAFLLRRYGGLLGVQVVSREVTAREFTDFGHVYEALDGALREQKQRKFSTILAEGFPEPEPVHHVCPTCDLTPVDEAMTCLLCREHHAAGGALPRTSHLVWTKAGEAIPSVEATFEWPDPIGVQVGLLTAPGAASLLRTGGARDRPLHLERLNDTDFVPPQVKEGPAGLAVGFRFLANQVPRNARGEVLEFSEIAAQSTGANYLGVLKADVDRLGLAFRRGLGASLSISRLATLSSMIDLFFTGWVGRIGRSAAPLSGEQTGPFYTMYAGGDDLLLVGPWDATILFAQELREDFARFCCRNPNLTLSAGVEVIRPSYPVRHFAHQVAGAVEAAKDAGRDRIRLFGRTIRWADGGRSLAELLELSTLLVQALGDRRIPRTLLHDLLRLYERYIGPGEQQDLRWTYRALYAIARRVTKEAAEELDLFHRIPAAMPVWRVPASYAILATRRR